MRRATGPAVFAACWVRAAGDDGRPSPPDYGSKNSGEECAEAVGCSCDWLYQSQNSMDEHRYL